MTRYETVNDAWPALYAACASRRPTHSRDGDARELLGVEATIERPDVGGWLTNPTRKASARYAAAELLWYMSGATRIDMIRHYAPQYARFAPDGVAQGAYGPRILAQVDHLLECLSVAGSRQAVLAIHDRFDLARAANKGPDVPCTQSLQFLIRDGRLHLIATMRSNDLWLGFPYDVWCFTRLQCMVAARAGVEVGWYKHQAGSLHLYERNLASEISHEWPVIQRHDHVVGPLDLPTRMRGAVILEERARAGEDVGKYLPQGCLVSECVALCATKWSTPRPAWLAEELLP